jgi:hypothetical protein
MNAYIGKPAAPERLFGLLLEHLGRQRPASEADARQSAIDPRCAPAAAGSGVHGAPAREVLQALGTMLESGEFGAIETWCRFEPAMLARHGDRASEIARRIRGFEHDAALRLLQSLAEEPG